MPIAANIGLALSAAAHNGAFSEVISALELLAGGKYMVALHRVCSSSPTWFTYFEFAAAAKAMRYKKKEFDRYGLLCLFLHDIVDACKQNISGVLFDKL
jgi:hypothetical protein